MGNKQIIIFFLFPTVSWSLNKLLKLILRVYTNNNLLLYLLYMDYGYIVYCVMCFYFILISV